MADVNAQGGTPGQDGDGGTQSPQELTWDGWLTAQDDQVKGLIDSHTSGLKSALDSERTQRKELAAALKETTKELGDNTDAKAKLEGISSKLAEYEQQMAFYEVATAAGVRNLKLAWIAAREAGAIDKAGNVNLESLKASYPELFVKTSTPPPGNAGAGTQAPPNGKADMDSLIRQHIGLK